jgi:hypothetical protein
MKHLFSIGSQCNICYMPTARLSSSITATDMLKRIRKEIDTLTPEVQRAARWVADHPSETGFLSMHQQARNAGVSAPTMVRLAARGGKAVLGRLAKVEKRLTSQRAYWRAVSRRAPA